MMQVLVLLGAALAAFALTAGLRRYALARQLMDVPNARSSHSVPTPRGGGVAFVLSFSGALCVLGAVSALPGSLLVGLLGAGGLVALLGFLDDHGHIAARWRLLGHFLAAAWTLYWVAALPAQVLFGLTPPTAVLVVPGLLYLVWMINLYNFMDGIDGLASLEAICVCIGGAILYALAGHPGAALLPLLLSACVAGFLLWNFPPARIFMGDAGSGFLGLILGAFALQAGAVSPNLFWAWTILLGVFVVDATFTLFRRLLRGDKVYQAHRSHAYQYAARQVRSHRRVSLAVVAINLGWLLPVAIAVVVLPVNGLLGATVAYAPLIVLAIRFRAGAPE